MSNDFIPYERYSDGWGFDLNRLYPTGKCKKKTITYPDGSKHVIKYIQVRTRIMGVPLWTRWVGEDYITWKKVDEQIFNCKDKCNG